MPKIDLTDAELYYIRHQLGPAYDEEGNDVEGFPEANWQEMNRIRGLPDIQYYGLARDEEYQRDVEELIHKREEWDNNLRFKLANMRPQGSLRITKDPKELWAAMESVIAQGGKD
jgi:hypothetical protein